ncbi:MAG: flagellar biosynthesis protein FlhA [Polyangiaceae bacterium]
MPPNAPSRPLRASFPLSGLAGADAGLAAFVVLIVALMVVPLPTWLLDILLAGNLSAAIAILLVVLYVPDAISIATFPTLLLITTLFRLSLNVSSTRLILLQANAGEVIRSFGQFVVRGNYVVGAVIFLILTIIQFVVIAKGSERVAEVGARFVLDAMPGKQMAIDAEARSGAIDGNEARHRRRQLARESQFYGAMDGAMKFVKGDVIASVIITFVNILGGLAIGVGQRGLEVETALKRYGLLTIGDGLVTQIPALVLSTAAGILVTRVASEEPDRSLGRELAGQILGIPKALQVAGIFVLGLAAVPGLPGVPFAVLGTLLLVAAQARVRQMRSEARRAVAEPARGAVAARRGPVFLPVVVPFTIDVSSDFSALLEDEARGEEIVRPSAFTIGQRIRERIFEELGVPLPAARVRVIGSLPDRHLVISLFEIPTRVIAVPQGSTEAQAIADLEAAALEVLRARAADFIGIAETQLLLDQLEQIAPALVRQTIPKPVTPSLLTDVLRRLVEERVAVRDLRTILEALSLVAPTEKDPLNLAEFVRSQLRRATTFRLTAGRRDLPVCLLDPTIEETIRHAVTKTAAGSFLALAPAAGRDVVAAIRRALTEAQSPGTASPASGPARAAATNVILTQPDVRRFVRKLIEVDLPDTVVVSYAELLPEIALHPVAKATLRGIG